MKYLHKKLRSDSLKERGAFLNKYQTGTGCHGGCDTGRKNAFGGRAI